MRTLYFDCFAGASGNMILAGLIDLGVGVDELRTELAKLPLEGYEIITNRVDRSGIASTHVEVRVPVEKGHRHLRHIREILDNSTLSPGVKDRALAIFTNLAAAEAKVHGIDIEKVHFHEVGAMDAIIDIVGACIGFEMLGIERFGCSSIHVGSGFVTMEHGKFPVPPPAVAELLAGKPIYSTEITGELITPTGAAIIATVCTSYGPLSELSVEKTGYGAGTREYKDFPNSLRLMLGESASETAVRSSGSVADLVMLETNIDDISPQILGYVMERALAIGALDCWFTPIQMKKNRPATMVSILTTAEKKESLIEMLYAETTTLGIRQTSVQRDELERRIIEAETEYGKICVKIAERNGEVINAMPEYDDVADAARKNGIPFRVVFDAAKTAITKERAAAK